MKPPALLLLFLLVFTGCASARLAQLPKPDGRYAPAIYAASSVSFSADRTSTLRDIAAKSDLTEAEQLYLLDVMQVTGGFSGDVKAVLLALLKNQAVSQGAKKRVSELLPSLGLFSGDAKAVADALAG
jgi:hypothetical protein